MSISHTSVSSVCQIYDELLHRIEHLAIALRGQSKPLFDIEAGYDFTQRGTPSVGETEYAFFKWNCAILTAFRNVNGLTKEANLQRNKRRNKQLKRKLIDQELQFRSVSGRYREAHWEKPVEEICFFVTNTDAFGKERANHSDIKEFFCKVYQLAEHYEQDSFLFTFPGANRVAFLVATNDNARKEFRGNIKFAGPLFTHVQDIGDWTECSDGRISFRLRGMIVRGGTGNERVKIGEGNLFDTEGYTTDGITIIRGNNQKDLKNLCRQYNGKVPLFEKVLLRNQLNTLGIQAAVLQSLDELAENKCQHIAIHCSISLGGSFLRGAKIALDTIKTWAQEHKKSIKGIIVVDIYGEYSRVLALEKVAKH